MGSRSSSATAPVNQQLSSGAASNVSDNAGAVSIINQLHDFGAVQGGLSLGQSAVSAANQTAEAAMMAQSIVSDRAITASTLQSAAALQSMREAVESSNRSAAQSSIAAVNAAARSVESSNKAAADSVLMANMTAADYMDKAASMTNNVMATTQDQLSKVLGAVSSNSLAMVSSSAIETGATEAMTQKLLIGAAILGAVMILKGK